MSSWQRFWEPKAVARIINGLDWEEELRYYKDGTSNQGEYIRGMTMMLERWMREWTLPDLARSLNASLNNDLGNQIEHALDTFENRIAQLWGFAQGLWQGANPRGLLGFLFGQTPQVSMQSESERIEQRLLRFRTRITELVTLSMEEEGVPSGEATTE